MSVDLSHAYVVDRAAPLPAALRGARALMLLLAAGTAVTVLAYLAAVELSGAAVGQSLWVCLPAVIAARVALRLRTGRTTLLRWGLGACGLWVLAALAAVVEGDPRGLTQLLVPVLVLVLLLQPTSRDHLLLRVPTAPGTPTGPPPRPRAAWWRLGAGTRAARAAREDGQGTMEYVGVLAAVAVVVGLVGLAFGAPQTRTRITEGTKDLICQVVGGPGCADDVAGGGVGSGDRSGGEGSGREGSGGEGSGTSEGCSGFWGCAWEGVTQVGSGLFNIGKGLWDDLVGLWELFQDPSLLVDALIHLWNNPSELLQLVWDEASRQMWESGDYGGAIGRTIWNIGSFFIPGVNLAKVGAKGGRLGKLANLASDLGQAGKLADDAAGTADAAADAARRGDAGEAARLADEARAQADEAAEQARGRGCPVAAGPAGSPGGLLALGAPVGSLTVAAIRPTLSVAVLAAGRACGDLTDAAREADEAADRANASALTAAGVDVQDGRFAQKTYSERFSEGGAFSGRTIDDVASDLRDGTLSPDDVQIDVIVRDGNTLILNTRSTQALERAGIPRSQWNVINRSGDPDFEARLDGQLRRNGLDSEGTGTTRSSGGG